MQGLTPVPCHGVTPVVGAVLIASHADQGLLVTPGPGAQQVIKTRLVIVLSLSLSSIWDHSAAPSFIMALRAGP